MAPPTFSELQQGLAALILDRRDVGLERWVSVPAGVEVSTRLNVYTGGYPARLREALLEAFPAVVKIIGDGSLTSMVKRYAAEAPTGWCNLNYVGRGLPKFLLSDQLSEELPFLPDLARLEWSVVECFHARVGDPFDIGTTASWKIDDWGETRIVFQPGVTLVSSPWPIHELRAARDRDRSEIDVDLVGRPQAVWVHRQGFEVVTELLGAAEAGVAKGLLEGRTLGDVMGQVEAEGADASRVSDLFSRFAALGLVAGCNRASDDPGA